MNAWTWIILGVFLMAIGGFCSSYGWYKLRNDTSKSINLLPHSTNIGQVTGGVVHTGEGSISITNYQGFSKDEARQMFKEELEKLLPRNPETRLLKTQAANAIAEGKIDEAAKLIKTVKLRTQQEFRDHVNKSIGALETNIINHNNGDQTAWLSITSQLYILLCDNIGGQVLIERVIPNFSLHPLLCDLSDKNPEDWIICDDTKKHSGPDGVIRIELFNLKKDKIPLEKWLKQVIFIFNKTPITIELMIKEVWGQAGPGHFSPEISDTLQSSPISREKGIERGNYIKYIVAIAEYAAPEIRKQLEGN
jgi:hypothetical protein